MLWPYDKLLMTIYLSKRVNTKTNTLMGAIGFYTGAVFSSFITIYSESYIENLTVHSKKDFKGLMSKKFKIMLTY